MLLTPRYELPKIQPVYLFLHSGSSSVTNAQSAALQRYGLSPSDWAAIATAVGTFTLAIVAAFQDVIRKWIIRPKLQVNVSCAPPDCHKTTMTIQTRNGIDRAPCYYFRIRVTNLGNTEAREVEVYAASLCSRLPDGSFAPAETFMPMNLLWANFRQPFLAVLSPRIPKHCDIAHIVHPNFNRLLHHELPGVGELNPVLAFDLQVEPNMKGHLAGPGTYRMGIIVAAANARPKHFELEIEFPGDWYNDEADMLSRGFSLRPV